MRPHGASSKDCFVYFVRRADGEGPVKIGCSIRPEERLSQVMTWAPYPLVIAARVAGDEDLERRFHEQFRAQWSHREWFFPSAELDAAIAAVAAGVFDFESLPTGKRLRSPRVVVWTEGARLSMSNTHRINKLWDQGIRPTEEIQRLRYPPTRGSPAEHLERQLLVRQWLDAIAPRKAA